MALLKDLKEWLGTNAVSIGLRLLGSSSPPPPLEEEDIDNDEPVPWPPVTMSLEAKRMVKEGMEAQPNFPLRSEEEPLNGSARERILKARARMEMGK